MSTKITQSQIEKIIKEELESALLEAVTVNDIKAAISQLRKYTDSSRMMSADVISSMRKVLDAVGDVSKLKNADEIDELIRVLKQKRELPGIKGGTSGNISIPGDPKTAKLMDDAIAKLEKASQRVKSKKSLDTKVKVATGATAIGAGAALMSMDPEDIVQSSDASQLQDVPPEALASFPEDELMSLPPEKQNIVKKKVESAKARRTRIAHATIKAKNAKDSVIRFQARLGALGYDLGKYAIDGDYGPATLGAVKAFQKANGLKDDGIVGRNTWKTLTSENAKGPGKAPGEAAASDTGVQHPSVNSAVSDSRWDDLFNTYVRARNNVNKAMMRQGRESFLGADETASKISELQDIVFRKVRQAGLPSLASSGRRPIGGDKKTVALKAAALLDRMMNEPSYFVQLLKDGNFLNDPTVIKAAAKQAIQSILDVKPVNEWKEFSKYSKLWQ